MRYLESQQNPLVKRLVSLQKKSNRSEQGSFVVEGLRAISGFFDHGWEAQTLLVRADLDWPTGWEAADCFEVSAPVSKKLSHQQQDPGYLAEFQIPANTELDLSLGGLLLYKVSDPGNCGTLIRTAAAFGWKQVVLLGSADAYGPKVIQSTVGALAGVSIHQYNADVSLKQFTGSASLAALVLEEAQPVQELVTKPRWLVVGSEAHGIDDEALAFCQERIYIPMAGQVESLNAAVAGSIAACLLAPK